MSILRTKRAFNMKQKFIFHRFFLVVRNCLRPESRPLLILKMCSITSILTRVDQIMANSLDLFIYLLDLLLPMIIAVRDFSFKLKVGILPLLTKISILT